jgi:hypothetical protein
MFLTWKQWHPLHYIASQGMPALQISNLRFKQARKSPKFGANSGTQDKGGDKGQPLSLAANRCASGGQD